MKNRPMLLLTAVAGLALAAEGVLANETPGSPAPQQPNDIPCGPLRTVTDLGGWLDYRARFSDSRVQAGLAQVDRYHTELARTNAAVNPKDARIIADLDFTLRYSPNHLDALRQLLAYDRNGGQYYEYFPVECYLGWAQQFAPDDETVIQLAAVYYARNGRASKAEELYLKAVSLNPKSIELHYLLGLFYADQKRYAEARQQARIAYDAGYPLAGLRNILERAGEWDSSNQTKSLPRQ